MSEGTTTDRMKKSLLTYALLFLFAVVLLTASQVQGSSPGPVPEPPTPTPEPEDSERLQSHLFDRYFDGREIAPGWLETQPLKGIFPDPGAAPQGFASATAVAVGFSHSCVLTDQGGVKCWGDNYLGQLGDGTTENRHLPQAVIGLQSGAAAISSLHKHTCALTTAGGAKCWGYNIHGELGDGTSINSTEPVTAIGMSSGVVDITAGGFHTCALLAGGSVKCWGANWHGQLGDGTKSQSLTPVTVLGLGGPVVDIAAGKFHTCALLATSGVQCWGYNVHGEVGDGTTIERHAPRDVLGMSSGVAALAVGGLHSCVLRTVGDVFCWGENSQGQLGNGTLDNQDQPTLVIGLSGTIQGLHLGIYHTCANLAGGGAQCWGDNWAGQVGDGSNLSRVIPAAVSGLSDLLTDIDGGDSHTCGASASGVLICWGTNEVGQLGNGGDALDETPVQVDGLAAGTLDLSNGTLHSCAVTDSGGVRCWGNNRYGQLGDGTTTFRLSPVAVSNVEPGATVVAAGSFHTCAIDGSTGLKCWGDNTFGQIGDGTKAQRNAATQVVGLPFNVVDVVAGERHTCALRPNGNVKCWGSNGGGRLGDGTTDPSGTPVLVVNMPPGTIKLAAGQSHTCALFGGGSIRCWGNNSDGQLGDGSTSNRSTPVLVVGLPGPAVDLTAGVSHTCAAISDGRAYCWGGNPSGQLGDGTFTKRLLPTKVVGLGSDQVVKIEAGGFHTCALLDNGSVRCWGDNWKGQLGDGSTNFRPVPGMVTGLPAGVVSLSGGAQVACAGITGAAPNCWGSNGQGQLGTGQVPWEVVAGEVVGLNPAVLTSDFSTGKPGSYFSLDGSGFPKGGTATVTVNGTVLSTALPVDSSGNLTFSLDTSLADEGHYTVVATSILHAGAPIVLSQTAPLHPPGGGTVLVVPAGIAMTEFSHLPILRD